ncbi:MAG: hypothetical protein ACYDGN_12985 [Acidimicrobiales bacterium]
MERDAAWHSWEPEDEADYQAANTELKERFASWAGDRGVEVDPDAPEAPIHYKWGYLDGHLTRWTRRDLNEVYLELYPAKVMVEDDEIDDVLAEARAFVRFLADTGLLDEESDSADVLVDHLGRIEKQFRANMADVSRYSFGKRLWTRAAAEGVRLDDPEAVEAFMAEFNARPRAEREAVLGRSPKLRGGHPTPGRFTPPGTRPLAPSAKRRKRRR